MSDPMRDLNEFREAAYTYARANLTGDACALDDKCQPDAEHGGWSLHAYRCRVHRTAALVMAAHDRLFPKPADTASGDHDDRS